MRRDILVLGKGYIGSKIQKAFECASSDAIIRSYKDAEKLIRARKPKIIINCAGFIGRNVDECEQDKDATLLANAFVPIVLGEVAVRHNIRLVHISSGCIYHYDYGKNAPVIESDEPDFLDLFYSRTKIYAEKALGLLARQYPILIVRIRIPLDGTPSPRNILSKLIRYKDSVIDVPNSVTYLPDLTRAVKFLVAKKATGIYNVVNKGGLRYAELLDVYKKYVPDFKYSLIDYSKLGLVRTNLIMSTRKLEKTGFKVRDIHEVLEECVKEYVKSS